MEQTEKITSASQFDSTPTGLAQWWGTEIEASRQELTRFHEDSERIVTRYLDKRDAWAEGESRVNLFWSTMKVLFSMLYARPPKADVSRAFQDSDDDQARVAGTIMQRLLNRGFEEDVSSWDTAVRKAIEDWLIVGLGQIWLRYEVETEMQEQPAVIDPMSGIEMQPAMEVEVIVEEDAPVDYVHWQDFFWSPARTWHEVRWVARRVYMTKDQLEARFGEEIARIVPLTRPKQTGENEVMPKYDPWARGEIFEIWCKEHKKVYWYAKGAEVILDVKDDPLDLEGFFPCPMPLAANVTTSNFIPRADYVFAQDQFEQLDEINTRIKWLTRAAKVVGIYDKAADGVQRMFQQASENQLIPVDNWAMFAESGGIKGKVDWVPIDAVVNAIERLRSYRQDQTMQIYEVLGISDIMRGSSNAAETATAQQIKAQFGSTRVQLLQFYIAQWISEALRIKAEIISKHFQPQTIVERSNIMRTPDAPFVQSAIQLLKDEHVAQYRINVEADSMAAMDWSAERDSAVQFLQGLGAFISQVSPLVSQDPSAGPYLLRVLQWGMSKFRVSSEIESVLDQAISKMQQNLAQPKQPQPDPKMMIEAEKIKSNERIAMMESQSDKEIANLKATIEIMKIQNQAAIDQMQMRYQQIENMMNNANAQQPVKALEQRVGQMDESNQNDRAVAMDQMSQLMDAVTRKRVRIPIRDANGDIVEVREMDEQDSSIPEGIPPGAAPLPPISGPMQ